ILVGSRSKNPRALHHPERRLPCDLLRDGRAIRHPCRSAGAFCRKWHHHGRDSAQADDLAAGRAGRHALPRQGSRPRIFNRRPQGLGTAHGRVPKGAFAALRTDMYKDWDADPKRFERSPFPAWAFETIKFLYEERGVTATGHESMDTDTTDKM